MNWDIVKGRWRQMKSDVRRQWAKLTDDDLEYIDARREQLVGRIQERYGVMKDDAERQVDRWLASRRDDEEQPSHPSHPNP